MDKMNNKGFSLREFIAVLLVMVIVSLILINLFFKGNESLPYKNFRNLAKNFSIRATSLHDNDVKYEKRVFLVDAIKYDHMDDTTSPFNKNEKCDKFESKVIFDDNNNKKVTIKCGNYLIFNESGFGKVEDYTIYEVSKWTDEELIGGDVQTETFYNYSVNGTMVLDRFMVEKEFLEAYSSKSGNNVLALSQVDSSKFKIETKLYYRTIKEVD